MDGLSLRDLKTTPAYFCGNPRLGRTTKLVVRATGRVLAEYIGIVSRIDAYRTFLKLRRVQG